MQAEPKQDKAEKTAKQLLLTWKEVGLAIVLSVALTCVAMYANGVHTPAAESRGVTAKSTRSPGFTLIELSIVLVIIGLIVGGVLVGQDLIRAARLRSVMTDALKFETAVSTYRVKYGQLPGDDPNAVSYWGSDPGGCAWNRENATPQQGTCDGNGNGQIEMSETFRAVQHLANAGLIAGQYSGACVDKTAFSCAAGYTGLAKPGINIPESHFGNNTGFVLFTQYAVFAPDPVWYSPSGDYQWANNYDLVIWFGASVDRPTYVDEKFNMQAGLTPSEAQQIDSKMDDGNPASGKVVTNDINVETCATSSTYPPWQNAATTHYNVQNTNVVCSLVFLAD